jgi:hypothetical protein
MTKCGRSSSVIARGTGCRTPHGISDDQVRAIVVRDSTRHRLLDSPPPVASCRRNETADLDDRPGPAGEAGHAESREATLSPPENGSEARRSRHRRARPSIPRRKSAGSTAKRVRIGGVIWIIGPPQEARKPRPRGPRSWRRRTGSKSETPSLTRAPRGNRGKEPSPPLATTPRRPDAAADPAYASYEPQPSATTGTSDSAAAPVRRLLRPRSSKAAPRQPTPPRAAADSVPPYTARQADNRRRTSLRSAPGPPIRSRMAGLLAEPAQKPNVASATRGRHARLPEAQEGNRLERRLDPAS